MPAPKRSTKAPASVNGVSNTLAPGDTVRQSISASIRVKGMETWVKVEADTVIGSDEAASQADERLWDFVTSSLADKIAALQAP